jgi:uncharacterized protein (TIGR02268 family)
MSSPLAAALVLALLTATSASAWPASEEWDTSGARHLELTAENAGEQHPVRISAHHSTNLVFNAPLQPGGVKVEDERLLKKAVNEDEGLVTLRPSGALPRDKPLTLTVRFADGLAPESVTFRLVVHPTRAEHEVRVYRQLPSCESHRREARQQRERAERCEAMLERERTCPEGQRPWGFTSLFEAGLLGRGKSIAVRNIQKDLLQRPGEPLEVWGAWSYRTEENGHRAVELSLTNTTPLPWTVEGVEGAELVSTDGERLRVARVWQPKPLAPGERDQLVVEVEATEKPLQGPFLLKLREAGGARTFTVRGVTFP